MSPEPLINLTLAVLFGGLIGFEREWNQGMAGLRTNALVAFGSACFVTISAHAGDDRVAAQIVSGIGFLGAGVILHEGPTVRGLNTAATLWCAAAAGSLAGFGLRAEGAFAAAGVIALNLGLRYVQSAIHRRAPHPGDLETTYAVEIVCAEAAADEVRRRFVEGAGEAGLQLGTLHQEQFDAQESVRISAELSSHSRLDEEFHGLVDEVRRHPRVTAAHWSLSVRGGMAAREPMLGGRGRG